MKLHIKISIPKAPELHKQGERNTPPLFRPIMSSIGTYNYKLAPIFPTNMPHKIDSPLFKKFRMSTHTSIPYLLMYKTFSWIFLWTCPSIPSLNIILTFLKMLFSFATTQSHFLFNDFIYDQIDGVAMSSPFAPILANLFMGHHEKSSLTINMLMTFSVYLTINMTLCYSLITSMQNIPT